MIVSLLPDGYLWAKRISANRYFFIYMHFEHNVEVFLFGRFCNDDFSNHRYYQISQSPRKMIILYKQLTVT